MALLNRALVVDDGEGKSDGGKNRDRTQTSARKQRGEKSGDAEQVDFMPQCHGSNCTQTRFYCKLILKGFEW